jgi:hypothetical protein
MAYDKTEVSVVKSQDAIRRLIYAHRGTGVMLISHPPREGFEAMVMIGEQSFHVRVMATCKDVSSDKYGIKRTGNSLTNTLDQEARRVWRVLYWHLKALFEAADSGVIDIRDVIMPYVVLADGRTLSDHVVPRMAELTRLEDTSRLLPA